MPLALLSELWRPRAALGLSLGAGSLHGVRLARTEEGFHLEGTAAFEFPADRPPRPAEVEAGLTQIMAALPEERARLAVGLPPGQAGLHLFDLPFAKPDKVRQVLRYEAEPLFLTPVEDLVLDYLPLPADEAPPGQGLVFGARTAAVAGALDEYRRAGLDPDVLLPETLGLVAAGQELFAPPGPSPRLSLLLDLGASQTGLVLFDQARPLIVRTVPLGGRDLTRALAQARGLDLVSAEALKRQTDLAPQEPDPADSAELAAAREALLQAWEPFLVEIERTLTGALAGRPQAAPRLVLAGGGALTPGLSGFLSARLGLEAVPLKTAAAEAPLFASAAPAPGLLPALGLALLALRPGPGPNLRQGDLALRPTLGRHRRSLGLMAGGLALAGLLALTSLVWEYRYQNRRSQAVKAEITRVFKKACPEVSRVVSPLAQLRQKLDQARGGTTSLKQAQGPVLDLLLAVNRVAASHEGLRVTNLALNPESLQLQGEGGSFESIDRLKNELAALPFFSEAALGGARVDPVTRLLTFKLSLTRKAP